MSAIYNGVLEFWDANKVSLVQPVSYDATMERFRAKGLNPAEDFVRFYSIVGGMTNYGTDPNLWSCWSMDKIISEITEYPRPGIPFGDWLIHSHVYVARAESAIRSSIWVDHFSENEQEKIADSLEDFFARYLMKDETTLILFDEPSILHQIGQQD